MVINGIFWHDLAFMLMIYKILRFDLFYMGYCEVIFMMYWCFVEEFVGVYYCFDIYEMACFFY